MSSSLPHNLIRKQFPALKQTINDKTPLFFDGPGGTQMPLKVIEAIQEYLFKGNSNLGGHFEVSKQTVDLVENARHHAAIFLGAASEREIVFGANMTSLTLHFSRSISRDWKAGDEIILTELDHGANRSPWELVAAERGVIVKYLKINGQECSIDLDQMKSMLSNKTKLVAVTAASNVAGTFVDITKVVEHGHAVGALVFIDAVHLLPHQRVNVQEIGCDFLASSSYKFFGPHLGLMYGRLELLESLVPYKVAPAPKLSPGKWETGTQSFEALAGFIASIEYLASLGEGDDLNQQLTSGYEMLNNIESELSELFLKELETINGVHLIGLPLARGVNGRTATFALTFDKHTPEEVAMALGREQIFVWNGHMYADKLIETLGLKDSGGVLRVGLTHYNTIEEIHLFFEVLKKILH
ncbi:MAG: cysteine desulfurase-like protein [Planctomycetota bacterium]|nr:MAG: cysteine desulfurase-like protein [Planctomycetota bacterium]